MSHHACRHTCCALVLLGVQGSALADGDMSGLAILVMYMVAALAVFWCGVTGFVFWVGRRLPKGQRFALSGFVLVVPLLALAGQVAVEEGQDAMRAFLDEPRVEPTAGPLVVGGVTFPAGSQVTYRQEGFWQRHPVAAATVETLSLGPLRLHQLQLSEFEADVLSVGLAAPQDIDGWPCSDQGPVLVRRNGAGVDLLGCWLAGARVAGIPWPAGARLARLDSGNWRIEWMNTPGSATADCEDVIPVRDFPLNQAMAEYDRERRLLTLAGLTCNRTIPLGAYQLNPWAPVDLGPDGVLRFSGNVVERQSGQALACLRVDREGRARPCAA